MYPQGVRICFFIAGLQIQGTSSLWGNACVAPAMNFDECLTCCPLYIHLRAEDLGSSHYLQCKQCTADGSHQALGAACFCHEDFSCSEWRPRFTDLLLRLSKRLHLGERAVCSSAVRECTSTA